MASFNSALFLSLLVAISAFMAAPSYVEAQFNPALGIIIRTNGTVSCALNVTLSPNNTVPGSLPPFPNATVQLRCGNTTVASTTTNASGAFVISVSPLQSIIISIISSLFSGGSNCKVVVNTPLVACNATLPAVGLVANVTDVVFSTARGLNIIDMVLRGGVLPINIS